MSSKKNAFPLVSSPLGLLQQMTGSLVMYLDKACCKGQKEEDKLLKDLEKERERAQKKLVRVRVRLEKTAMARKHRAHARARLAQDDLEESLRLLQFRQGQLLAYAEQLREESGQAMALAGQMEALGRAGPEAISPPPAAVEDTVAEATTPPAPAAARRSRQSAGRTRSRAKAVSPDGAGSGSSDAG